MNIVLAILGASAQGLLWGMMALGVYITFKILNFADMTCDGSFALGGCVSATLSVSLHWNPFATLIVSMLAGMLAGIVTGLLHTKLKIPAILSGILTMISLYSINLRIGGKSNVPINTREDGVESMLSLIKKALPESIASDTNINTWISMVIGIVVIGLFIALLYWFFGTEIGSAFRATGDNEDMIRALGVSTDNMKILGLLISNGLIALSGGLVAQAQSFGDVSMGQGTIVIGLASIVMGEVIIGNKVNFAGKLLSVVIGSVLYRIVVAVVLQLGLKTDDLKMLTAIVVAIALSIPVFTKKKAARITAK